MEAVLTTASTFLCLADVSERIKKIWPYKCFISGWSATSIGTSAHISTSSTITHHGGSLSLVENGSYPSNLTTSISGNTLYLSKGGSTCKGMTVAVTSAATQNYTAASATYYCNN